MKQNLAAQKKTKEEDHNKNLHAAVTGEPRLVLLLWLPHLVVPILLLLLRLGLLLLLVCHAERVVPSTIHWLLSLAAVEVVEGLLMGLLLLLLWRAHHGSSLIAHLLHVTLKSV